VVTVTILDGTRATAVDAVVDAGAVLVDAEGFGSATGWELAPEGLCRDGVCVPLAHRPGTLVDGRIDVEQVAPLLGRSAVADGAAGVVALGEAAAHVAEYLGERQAADFTLAQLDGTPFTFSSLGRKKKLLVVWASW
jgi:hypothetical protein